MALQITLIAAFTNQQVIGVDNKMPWHLPEDFAFFKSYTLHKPILMGRKTWESLTKRPLPERKNIVISRDQSYLAEGAIVVDSLSKAIESCGDVSEVCIIGGAQIYQHAMAIATDLRITQLDLSIPEGDCFFPTIVKEEWHELERIAHVAKNGIHFQFIHYQRINNEKSS